MSPLANGGRPWKRERNGAFNVEVGENLCGVGILGEKGIFRKNGILVVVKEGKENREKEKGKRIYK